MYYVYMLIDPKTQLPFYIGKGKENRYLSHQKFKDNCKNVKKDEIIKNILQEYNEIPYKIIKNFDNEDDAYDYEELLIKKIGIKNLANICPSRRPPNQKGKKRKRKTIKMISKNSKFHGLQRTISHVVNDQDTFYALLVDIKNGERRSNTVKKLNITIDLYNKVKKNCNKYIKILNEYTEYSLPYFKNKKINGMKAKLYNDNKDLLIKIYRLIDSGHKRKQVIEKLNIDPAFYDRVKDQKKEFFDYFSISYISNDVEVMG